MKKLTLILKNNYLFFISIYFIQTFIDYFRSSILEKAINSFKLGNWKVLAILLSSFITVITSEVLPDYVASSERFKTLIFNDFLLNIAYLVTVIFSPLKLILKERKKFFAYNEEDLIRFINNLTSKEILLIEPSEAKLVKLAFNMDDKDVISVMIPLEKTVYLNSSMQTREVIEFCLKKNFTKYPVFNNNQQVIGIFNVKSLVFPLLNGEKTVDWKSYINRKITFFEQTTKLSIALEKLKQARNYFAIIRNKQVITGIITLKDVLGSLVGKICDEKF